MANKSVLDIQVNDEQFKAFYELFQEYQQHLGSVPDDWKRIDQATKRAAKSFEAVTAGSAALLADIALHTKEMSESLKKATSAQKNFHKETKGSADQMKKMAGYAKSLGSHIFGIGKYLFKIGALGGGLSLLGGFGLRELGEGAVRRQMQARALGLNQGQTRAWNIDLSRYLGIGAVHSVAGAQVDSGQWGTLIQSLSGTGIGLNQALSMAPDRLAHAIAVSAANRWNRESSTQRGVDPFLKAQASLLGGTEALRSLATAQRKGEFSQGWAQYKRDSLKYGISDKTTSAWYTFTREISAAGATIDTVLVKRLSALAPSLADLLKSLTSDGAKLINGVLSKDNVDAIKRAMDEFAKFVASGEFESKVKSFAKALGEVADVTISVAEWIRKHFPTSLFTNPPGKTTTHVSTPKGPQVSNSAINPNWAKLHPKEAAALGYHAPGKHALVSSLEKQYGLPKGVLWNVYGTESSFGANMGPSRAGALGPFQWMAASAPAYGVKDRMSFSQSASGAARYFHQALIKYKGDLSKAAASYNWGYGNLDADIKAHGSKWLAFAPRETQGYVRKVTSGVQRVIIENKAGSNVAVSLNAAY